MFNSKSRCAAAARLHSITHSPRAHARDHHLIEDIKRKDFIAMSAIEDEQVLAHACSNS